MTFEYGNQLTKTTHNSYKI